MPDPSVPVEWEKKNSGGRKGEGFPEEPFELRSVGAGNRTRTGDINLGKVALYQLSYSREVPAYSSGAAFPLSSRELDNGASEKRYSGSAEPKAPSSLAPAHGRSTWMP